MNKIVLVPDSFKGTMSSQEICCIMKKEILSFFPAGTGLVRTGCGWRRGQRRCLFGSSGRRKNNIAYKGAIF